MQVQARTYVRYTNRRVNQMKQGLRAGTARKELAKTLSDKYGKGSLDIETGIFTPVE